jgi:hypothetical protein
MFRNAVICGRGAPRPASTSTKSRRARSSSIASIRWNAASIRQAKSLLADRRYSWRYRDIADRRSAGDVPRRAAPR